MAKGKEKVGPSIDDIKRSLISLVISIFIYKLKLGIPRATDLDTQWMIRVFIRNFVLMSVIFSVVHRYFYTRPQHKQWIKDGHKFDNRLPSKAQYKRDREYTILSLIINSIFEVIVWKFQTFSITMSALQLMFWIIVLPIWREIHVFICHNAFHSNLLYEPFHTHHHLSHNPGPWSGLSLHPMESIAYFSSSLLPFVLGLHPLHYIYYNIYLQIIPIFDHLGYDIHGSYFHYLHHKKLNVNFGRPCVPLDILTNSWCTGC
eukprot:653907_1